MYSYVHYTVREQFIFSVSFLSFCLYIIPFSFLLFLSLFLFVLISFILFWQSIKVLYTHSFISPASFFHICERKILSQIILGSTLNTEQIIVTEKYKYLIKQFSIIVTDKCKYSIKQFSVEFLFFIKFPH